MNEEAAVVELPIVGIRATPGGGEDVGTVANACRKFDEPIEDGDDTVEEESEGKVDFLRFAFNSSVPAKNA